MADFVRQSKVRFSDTDYAGIIFYPRYFEGLNATVEDWFAECAGVSFRTLLDEYRLGSPLVSIETTFMKPSRLEDILEYRLNVSRIGASSITFKIETICGNETRMRATLTHVCVQRDVSESAPWPEALRKQFNEALSEAQ